MMAAIAALGANPQGYSVVTHLFSAAENDGVAAFQR